MVQYPTARKATSYEVLEGTTVVEYSTFVCTSLESIVLPASLTGYDAAIKETGRLTNEKIEMDEEALSILNMKFQILVDSLDDEPEVTFTYFKPDERKAGGVYIEVTGTVKKVDDFERLIVLQNGTKIPMNDILSIDGDIFASIG